jgi:hypothetical protein
MAARGARPDQPKKGMVDLLVELAAFAADLRVFALKGDDEVLADVAADLSAVVLRHALDLLEEAA